MFGTAPRELTGDVSLHQTVEMVRMTIEIVEENIEETVGERDEPSVRDSIVRYAREIAFATAQVYAQAAEARGAWDARLESLVVNAVLCGEADEAVRSRAGALGWNSPGDVVVVLGRVPGRTVPRASRSSTRPARGPARRAPGADRGARRPAGGRRAAASTTRTRRAQA